MSVALTALAAAALSGAPTAVYVDADAPRPVRSAAIDRLSEAGYRVVPTPEDGAATVRLRVTQSGCRIEATSGDARAVAHVEPAPADAFALEVAQRAQSAVASLQLEDTLAPPAEVDAPPDDLDIPPPPASEPERSDSATRMPPPRDAAATPSVVRRRGRPRPWVLGALEAGPQLRLDRAEALVVGRIAAGRGIAGALLDVEVAAAPTNVAALRAVDSFVGAGPAISWLWRRGFGGSVGVTGGVLVHAYRWQAEAPRARVGWQAALPVLLRWHPPRRALALQVGLTVGVSAKVSHLDGERRVWDRDRLRFALTAGLAFGGRR